MHKVDYLKNRPAHGGHLRAFAERFQIAENEIIDFSSNVNPLNLSESVLEIYAKCALEIGSYPDPDAYALREEITRHYPCPISNVLPGNGAVSLIGLAVRTLTPKKALVIEPCFTEYRRILELQSTEVVSIRLEEANDFAFPFQEILRELANVELLILVHPNSPTGTALAKDDLLELLTFAKQHGVFVIVDEAFADWCPEISVAASLNEDSNFVVIRSLTKFYGLAGIRAGFALGPTGIIESMKRHQNSWDVNVLAQKLSTAMLQETGFIKKTREWFLNESRWFYQQLNEVEAFKVFPSRANFFLMKYLSGESQEVFEFLGRKGCYIRLTEDYPYLGMPYFRVAIRLRHENEILIKNLKDYSHL